MSPQAHNVVLCSPQHIVHFGRRIAPLRLSSRLDALVLVLPYVCIAPGPPSSLLLFPPPAPLWSICVPRGNIGNNWRRRRACLPVPV